MPSNEPGDMTDLDQPATRRDLLEVRTELRTELAAVREDLRRHFDIVAESFRAEFRNLFDFVHATTNGLGERVDSLERDHSSRLLNVETRVTRLEKRRK